MFNIISKAATFLFESRLSVFDMAFIILFSVLFGSLSISTFALILFLVAFASKFMQNKVANLVNKNERS